MTYAMNRRVVIALILLATGVSAALAEPALTIPETDFNFGFVPQHAKISHVYWLHSTGTDTLRIVNVAPG